MEFLPGQRYDCLRCGRSCSSGWQVFVDWSTRRRLESLKLVEDAFEQRGAGACLKLQGDQCIFLEDGHTCKIHAQVGGTQKPETCQMFPFLPVETPDGVLVGASFFCTAIQQNQGRPLAEHRADIERLAKGALCPRVGFNPIPLANETTLAWPTYKLLEAELLQRFQKNRWIALGDALWNLCWWWSENEPTELRPEDLPQALEPGPEDPFLTWLSLSSFHLLLARMESPGSGGVEALRALQEDQEFCFDELWTGRLSVAVQRVQSAPEDPGLNALVDRYVKALLFRKILAIRRPLLENLLLVHFGIHLLRFYAHLRALSQQREKLNSEDLFYGLDRVELVLLTHTGEGYAASENLVRFCLDRARTLRQTNDRLL